MSHVWQRLWLSETYTKPFEPPATIAAKEHVTNTPADEPLDDFLAALIKSQQTASSKFLERRI